MPTSDERNAQAEDTANAAIRAAEQALVSDSDFTESRVRSACAHLIDVCKHLARALRESAQREADAERANRDERAIWSRVMERLTGNGTYATSEIESAIAKAEADAFKRGVEAALEKLRPCLCLRSSPPCGECDRCLLAAKAATVRAILPPAPAASGADEMMRGQPRGPTATEFAVNRHPPAPAATTETHEFVPLHVGADYCLHAFDAQRLCGERRSHPIHQGKP